MDRKPVTLHKLREMHKAGEKVAMLTCYDSAFAALLDDAGVDCLLVGDSLGMVLQGRSSTNAVTLQDMAYHVACRAAGRPAQRLVPRGPGPGHAFIGSPDGRRRPDGQARRRRLDG
jgi:3-methyl-2-oxobutanoate hydroxymethyltransferase